MKKAIMARFAKLEGYNHERDGIKIPQQPKVCHAIDSALRELKESGEAHIDVVILEALTQEMDEMISDGTLHTYYKQHVVGTTYLIYLGSVKN